jgi:hypothetical protein
MAEVAAFRANSWIHPEAPPPPTRQLPRSISVAAHLSQLLFVLGFRILCGKQSLLFHQGLIHPLAPP